MLRVRGWEPRTCRPARERRLLASGLLIFPTPPRNSSTCGGRLDQSSRVGPFSWHVHFPTGDSSGMLLDKFYKINRRRDLPDLVQREQSSQFLIASAALVLSGLLGRRAPRETALMIPPTPTDARSEAPLPSILPTHWIPRGCVSSVLL